MNSQSHVTVIGAGIVGINCAVALAKSGHAVRVIDRVEPGEGCSFGNAGLMAASAYEPQASPGTLLQVPMWLLDPDGPLVVRWRYLPRLMPWLLRYLKAGLFGDHARARDGLYHLMSPSIDLYEQLAEEAGAPDLVRRSGAIYAYTKERKFRNDRAEMLGRRERGFPVHELNEAELRAREPNLATRYRWGYLVEDYAHVTSPKRMVTTLADYAKRLGVEIEIAEILDFEMDGKTPVALLTDQGRRPVEHLVIAAGAYSHQLSAKLGDVVPLETERGYHVTIENPGVTTNIPVMDSELMAWVTPMEMGMRCAGTVELASLDAPENEQRALNLLKLAKRMVPDVDTSSYTTWMGRRPTLPDSLPVIGPATKCDNVFYAFGHQHLGLTGAPATARLIAQLVGGHTPNLDMSAYRPDRF